VTLVERLECPLDAFITLDWETYYSADYTLSKMTTADYVRDPRFQTIGVGVKVNDGPRFWMEDAALRAWAATVDWSRCAVLAHHAHFDGLILSHHYGVLPGFWLDTLSMARALHGTEVGGSLAKLAVHYGAGEKGHEVLNAKGKRRADFTPEEWLRYGEYCKNDVELTYDIFHKMLAGFAGPPFPEVELWNIDTTVRMFTEPSFVLNEPLLRTFLASEQDRKKELMRRVLGSDGEGMSDEAVAEAVRPVLLSNDKFAALLIEMGEDPPRKVSAAREKTRKKLVDAGDPAAEEYDVTTWALAKSDPGMQTLLEHEEDEIRWLAEARIGVKSTINETRTERFLKAGEGGRSVPVYLKYGAAHTFRWGGGDRMNFQNLVRGGELRKSLLAPPGHLLVVADSGQIEARVIGWLAGHADLMDIFRRNDALGDAGDFYSDVGSTFFGKKLSKKETPVERQISKSMCLAAETPVLTRRGWVSIVDVTTADQVWDGVEWVNHGGLLDQGEQEVWEANSVAATPDHGILTAHGWREWSEVLTNPSLFRSALASVTLPFSHGSGSQIGAGTILDSGANAGVSAWCTGAIFSGALPCDAMGAQSEPLRKPVTAALSPSCRTTRLERGFLRASPRALRAASAPITETTSTTGRAGSGCTRHGWGTARRFWRILSGFLVGITRTFTSTGSTTAEVTSPEICGSLPPGRTCGIAGPSRNSSGESSISKRRTMTYDIASAGPRSRFTILTDAGPVIAHNCLGLGFGMGWFKFSMELNKVTDPTTGKKLQFRLEHAEQFGVDVDAFLRFKGRLDGRKVERIKEMPSRLPFEERVVHCAVTNEMVRRYRETNLHIVNLWDQMETVLAAMDKGMEMAFGPGGCLRTVRHGIVLPNGLVMRYPGLRCEDNRFSYMGGKGGRQRVGTYGGSIAENVTQALARIIVAEQMLAVRAQYGLNSAHPTDEKVGRVATTTHDEVVFSVREELAEEVLAYTLKTMQTPPEWAKGLPLNASGDVGKSYGECK
jgi:hypothetical protein